MYSSIIQMHEIISKRLKCDLLPRHAFWGRNIKSMKHVGHQPLMNLSLMDLETSVVINDRESCPLPHDLSRHLTLGRLRT